jgi:predicted PurR-regulated permease PerM
MKDNMPEQEAIAGAPAAGAASATPPTPASPTGAEVLAVAAEPEPERVHLHMPVDIRSISLVVLAGLASLFVLHWAKAVFIPVMLSVMFSYALSPMVNWLELKRVPRWLSSAVLLLAIVSTIGSTVYSLGDQASQLVEAMPVAAQKFRQAMKTRSGKSNSTLDIVQKAAAQIEQAAQESGSAPVVTRGAMRVIVEPARFDIKRYLWSGTIGLIALIGQTTAVLFLTYFLMLSGDTFRRKLVKLAGPTLSSKKITLQALHEVTGQIQRYLQVQLLTSLLVGVLTWGALLALGLDNAPVWGVIAGVLNLVPYVGSLVTAAASGLVGFLQFGSLNMAMAVAGASLVIHTLVGNLLTPWLTSRASRLSPVAVFVGLLAWGWLWGVWGLLLGVPILMIVKSVCDRVDDLKPIGEFLGS